MKITITARELFDRGLWMDYCNLTGTNDWAIAEGLMSDDEELSLTHKQAKKLGLLALTPEEKWDLEERW
ncbi:MAG: hypothetical protein DWQ19_09995 [Crenarchaeota archaeon]|nr:MAG: hypothetical protein DWQ19_09995 [Thermoproteota archaeon]